MQKHPEGYFNLDAERSVLGYLLLNNNAFEEISEVLKAEDFYTAIHKNTYEIISHLLNTSQIADITTVSNFTKYSPKYVDISFEYLADLSNSILTLSGYMAYSQLIHELFLKRQLLGLQQNITSYISSNTEFSSIVNKIEHDIFQLTKNDMIANNIHFFHEAAQSAYDLISSAKDSKGQIIGITTGLKDLDRMLGGLHKSDLIILAGRPSMGKTALAVNMGYRCAEKYMSEKEHPGSPVALFSLEMAAEQIANRILSAEVNISSDALRKGKISESEFLRLTQLVTKLRKLDFFIDDTPSLTISQIRTKCRQLKRKHDIGFVIIDYIQLIKGEGRQENRVTELSDITRGLKAIAKEINVPILALSQLNRAVENRDDKIPMLADLRESGSIEQDADIVSFIFREEYYKIKEEPKMKEGELKEAFTERHNKWQEYLNSIKNQAKVIIAKNRHGPIGTVNLFFDPNKTLFSDLDTVH